MCEDDITWDLRLSMAWGPLTKGFGVPDESHRKTKKALLWLGSLLHLQICYKMCQQLP